MQTTFTRDELLMTEEGLTPLFAGGMRCHGGFDADGAYRSPRVLHRAPAIAAWQAALGASGDRLLEIDRSLIPPQYPSLDQARLLLKNGVREPIVRVLTLVSIAEGFGAIVRDLPMPPLGDIMAGPIDGTALAHLDVGLLEAHARDEAGHKDEGGHKQMWEAARDLALEKPRVPGDVLLMLTRRRTAGPRERRFPELDGALEALLTTLANVLVIEVFAARTFDWGERLLSDPEISAAPEAAGRMVAYVRRDETPHVEYLRTVLSEVRARTVRTTSGATMRGDALIDSILHHALTFLTTTRPREQRENVRTRLHEAIRAAGKGPSLADEFDALETPWTPPPRTGFEPSEA